MSMRQLKITKSITNRESQSLEKYLQEIGKVELIGPEEEVRLARMIKHGDQAALDRLTAVVHGELHRIARRYMRNERPGNTLQATALVNEVYLRWWM